MLFLPFFWLGYPLGLLLLAGGIAGYIYYRNPQVPEPERWTASLESFHQRRAAAAEARQQNNATLTMTGPDGKPVPIPAPGDEDLPAYLAFDALLGFGLPRNANQIDLSVDTNAAKYRTHIDGVRYPNEAPEPAEAVKLIDYIKKVAGLDLQDRRRKQESNLEIRVEDWGPHKLHVVSAGSTKGLQMQILIDPEKSSNIPLEHLGLVPNQLQQLRGLLEQPGKTVLVASAPQQGKTTTLYSLLHTHDPYTSSIITLEEEIVAELEGVDHNTITRGKPAGNSTRRCPIWSAAART